MGVVRGAVEGIHDPPVRCRAAARAAFLGKDGMVREASPDRLHDEGFGLAVHLSHEVGGAALVGDMP